MRYIKLFESDEDNSSELMDIKAVLQEVIDEFDFELINNDNFGPTDKSDFVYSIRPLDRNKRSDSYMRKQGYRYVINFLIPEDKELYLKFEQMMMECRDHFHVMGYKDNRDYYNDQHHIFSGYDLYTLYI
jgi:hypothetical protein